MEVTTEIQPSEAAGVERRDLSVARRVAWYALLVMVFLVPLVMSDYAVPGMAERLTFSSVDVVKLAVERVLVLVALAAWGWDILRKGGRVRHTPVDWLIAAWLLWSLLSTILSVHWPTALFGVQGRYEGFLTFVMYALIYFLVLQFADNAGRVRRLAQVLLASSVIVAAYGLLQFTRVVFVPSSGLPWDETNRAFSTFGNPNMLGGFLVFTAVVALGLVLQERRTRWRVAYWVGFGLNCLALIVSFTRGAWIGAGIGIVLLAVMAWRQRTGIRRVDIAPAGIFAAAVVAVIVRSLSQPGQVMNFAKRIGSIFQFGSGSGQTRTEIWRAALAGIKQKPLTGWGPDTFTFVFSKFKPAAYVRDAGGSSGADNAHDYPLHLAAGIGVVGALLFFAIWVWAGVRSFKTVFGRPGDATRILVGAFWAAAAGYMFHLLFSLSVPGVTFLLWIALALVLSPTTNSSEVKPRNWAKVAAVPLVLILALGVAGEGIALAADRDYTIGSEEFSQRPLDDRAAAAAQAMRLDRLVPEFRATVAALARERVFNDIRAVEQAQQKGADTAAPTQTLRQDLATAESSYQDAIGFTPDDYANYVNLASMYNAAAPVLDNRLYDQAIHTANQGLDVMPNGTDIRVQLADALVGVGRVSEATQTLQYSLQLDPRDGSAALALAAIYVNEGKNDQALALLKAVDAAAPGQAGMAGTIEALEKGQQLP